MCGICSNLIIEIPERRRRTSGVFTVNFEQIPHIVLVFRQLNLIKYMPAGLTPLTGCHKRLFSKTFQRTHTFKCHASENVFYFF